MDLSAFEKGLLVLASMQTALANGVKHYHADGRLLDTDKAILQALVDGVEVRIDESERVQRVTVETVFEKLRRETPLH